jgi:hypothetical protein
MLFEAVCQAPLTACHARDAGADCRYQRSQGRSLCFCNLSIMPFVSKVAGFYFAVGALLINENYG